MGKRRWRRVKAKRQAVVVPAWLGKFGAMFTCRGNPLVQIVAVGPRVTASTPEELERATAAALEEKDAKKIN
jgi:hypothetical protein